MRHRLILTPQPDEYRERIEAAALPDLSNVATSDVEEGLARGAHSDLLLGDPARVRLALPHLPKLVWVQVTWAGIEPMLDSSLRRDYVLTNVRGAFGPLMSEFVFAYLLLHERKVLKRLDSQRAGRWDATPPGMLRGKTLGLVGVGSIGAHLATTAKHFGMRVHGYTRSSRTSPDVDRYFHGTEKAAFAAGVDFLVAVLPNTPETCGIIDHVMIGALPSHALLINAGRGQALDEPALIHALTAGRLAGAILDVFSEEPLPADHPFWRTPNLFFTSHTAAPSLPEDAVRVFVNNYRRFVAGEPLLYRVDFDKGY
jgi:phosphoglycerate dehydrogenase-like enzyme